MVCYYTILYILNLSIFFDYEFKFSTLITKINYFQPFCIYNLFSFYIRLTTLQTFSHFRKIVVKCIKVKLIVKYDVIYNLLLLLHIYYNLLYTIYSDSYLLILEYIY